ncbi:MAG: two-component regulator propeller domain-containing protein, partial [Bacteroidota bacterium]
MAKYLTCVLITTFTLSNSLWGQKTIRFDRHISLPSNPVFCITQDERGFVWFGTKNGLLRFDGYSFDVFNAVEGDTTTINNDWVWSLYNDTQGNIWVGTGFGLNIWIPEENGFRNIDLPLENGSTNSLIVRKIFEDKSGRLWIGTNYGLYSGGSNDHRFNKHELRFDLSQSANFDIKEISEDLNGNILISSQYGIFSLENDRPTERNVLLNSILTSESHSDEVRTVFLDKLTRTFWIGTQSQNTALIRYLEGFAPEIVSLPGSIETNSIRAIRNFGDSKLWLGTMNGLIIYDTITYSKTTLLEYQSVRDIFKDNEGGIWIATYNDGIYYQSSRGHWFEHVTGQPNIRGSPKGQRDNVVNDMVKVDNQIWMATEFGLKLYDPSEKTVSLYPGISREGIGNNRLKCLVFQDDSSLLWMGTFNGLASLNIKTGEFQNFNSSSNESPGSWMEIYDIVVIDNEVWAGTNNRGLICISKNGLIDQYADHFNKSANHINALHVAPDKTLWVGSNAGLSTIDPETKRLRRIGSENYFFKSENIISISQDEKDNLWLGTERSGLIYFSTKTLDFRFIRKEHGLLSNKIKSVEVDNRGHLWVTTDEGLSEIILSGTDDFSSISFEIFDFAIQSEGGSPYFLVNSSYRTPEGDMLYGTRDGFLIFSPDKVQNRRWYPKVWIKDISINQEHIMKDKRLIQRFGSVEELT